jgi:hypothetical protein
MKDMDKRESTAEIKFCMKQEIRWSYGWADRENDPFVKNHPNEEFIKSCNSYWGALRHAWYTYSKSNTLALQAKEERDDAIQEAKNKYLSDDEQNYDSKTFLKGAYQIYDRYANTVAPIFHEFKKELRKKRPNIV